MAQSKLILLEGVPGAGKSTMGLRLQDFLEKQGITTRFWREGDFDHPADFEGIACLSASGYQNFLSRYPDLAGFCAENLVIRGADHLLSYRKLQHNHPQLMPQALVDELSHFDVYDGLPMSEYCRLSLERWQDFQQATKDSDTVTLLECCLLQNPLTVLLARHDAGLETVRRQVLAIAEMIRDLNPLVVYMSPQNVGAALEHVHAERPKEWADFVIGYLTRQAYGQNHHLVGFEGVIYFYEMRQKLEIEILRGLPLESVLVEHAVRNWERCNSEVVNFVGAHLPGRDGSKILGPDASFFLH